MKKLLICLLCLVSLTACANSDYQRDNTPGKREFITLAQMQKMMQNKQSFIVVYSVSTCSGCAQFNNFLKTYLKDHHVIVNEVMLDFEETSEAENLATINKYFKDFNTTPTLYYVKKGKVKAKIMHRDLVDETVFDEFITKYQLDKTK